MRTATILASLVCMAALAQPAQAQFSELVVTNGAGWRSVTGVRGEARNTYSAPAGAALWLSWDVIPPNPYAGY